MLEAIRAMLGSKKFIAAIAGVIATALMRFGWDVDVETVVTVLTPIIAYIIGQGVADFGSASAKIAAAQTPPAQRIDPQP